MKRKIYDICVVFTLFLGIGFSSCSEFLDIIPKGEKIPTTLADFEAFLRDEYTCQRVDINQALVLLNDRYVSDYFQNYYPLWNANYFWDEKANRVVLNNSDETTYYASYAAISTFNLIIENSEYATKATDDERSVLIAQAKVLRAMTYFVLANFYAETYSVSAVDKLSVPLITSAIVDAPYAQVSVQDIYDFMLRDVEDALPFLPEISATVLHPTLGTAYAFLARYYLQISNYQKALSYAEKALEINSILYDWTEYYRANQTQIENPSSYTRTASPMGFDYVENYNFRHGSTKYVSSENNVSVNRAAIFEPGDARFASRWKLRTVGTETYYYSTLTGFFNYGGITTTEVYLIKAECLARTGSIDDAMDVLNTVREKRILPSVYMPLTAASSEEALKYIIKVKCNELIMTLTPFADTRRWNREANLARTLTKMVEGTTYSLLPSSIMWTMPFPQGAIDNPGNGSIRQNVDR